MIFNRNDAVVAFTPGLKDRFGIVDRRFRKHGCRMYIVQFGAGGPFEEITEDCLRPASAVEERDHEVYP